MEYKQGNLRTGLKYSTTVLYIPSRSIPKQKCEGAYETQESQIDALVREAPPVNVTMTLSGRCLCVQAAFPCCSGWRFQSSAEMNVWSTLQEKETETFDISFRPLLNHLLTPRLRPAGLICSFLIVSVIVICFVITISEVSSGEIKAAAKNKYLQLRYPILNFQGRYDHQGRNHYGITISADIFTIIEAEQPIHYKYNIKDK